MSVNRAHQYTSYENNPYLLTPNIKKTSAHRAD